MYDAISPIEANALGSMAYGGYGAYGLGGYGAMSPYGIGGYGMMGMMNPTFMAQMYKIQQDMEKAQLEHADTMHGLIQQSEVNHLSAHNRAIFQKALVDGDIQNHIRNLSDVIRAGDQDAICIEYDKLKNTIYTKYASEIDDGSNSANVKSSIDDIITLLYNQILTKQNGGEPVDLRNDIKKYGETAFSHGFNKTFMGKDGYHDNYSEETLSYLYGTRIDNKGGKDRMEKGGSYIARLTEAALSVPIGAAAGAGAGVGILGAGSILTGWLPKATNASGAPRKGILGFLSKGRVPFFKHVGKFGKVGASVGLAAGLVGDLIWQATR